MTNKEILEKAIQKAKSNGWEAAIVETEDGSFMYGGEHNGFIFGTPIDLDVIYNQKFAKALWGEPWAYFTEGQSGDTISGNFVNWKGHLANMVISEDPIKYLGENI